MFRGEGVQDLEFRFKGLGFRVCGFGCRVQGLGSMAEDTVLRV